MFLPATAVGAKKQLEGKKKNVRTIDSLRFQWAGILFENFICKEKAYGKLITINSSLKFFNDRNIISELNRPCTLLN